MSDKPIWPIELISKDAANLKTKIKSQVLYLSKFKVHKDIDNFVYNIAEEDLQLLMQRGKEYFGDAQWFKALEDIYPNYEGLNITLSDTGRTYVSA